MDDSTTLVQCNEHSAVNADISPDETGLEQVAGLKPTNLLLVQNTTRDAKGARPGQILDVLTEEAHDSVVIVPLKVTPRRVMFPVGSDLDAEPICRSDDGIVPAEGAKAPQAVRCAVCPNSAWRGGQKPPCAEKLNLLVILKESGLPRFFTVGGLSIKALRLVLERIRQDVHMNRLKGVQLKLYDYFFTLSAEKVVDKKGSYFVARFDNVTKVANPSEFGPLFEQFVTKAREQGEETATARECAANSAVGAALNPEVVDV